MYGRELQRTLNHLEDEAMDMGVRVVPFAPFETDYAFLRYSTSDAGVTWKRSTTGSFEPMVLAYNRNDPNSFFILAHEMGHLVHLRSDGDAFDVLLSNPGRVRDALILWFEERAWDMAEVILRHHVPSFDRSRFLSVKEYYLRSYGKAVPARRTGSAAQQEAA